MKDSIERKKPKKSKLNNLSAELEGENCSKKNAKTRKIKGQSDVKSSGKPAKVKSKQKNAGTAKLKVSSKCKKTTADADMEEKWMCTLCKGVYGDKNDKLPTDDWFPCVACDKKFHEHRAEDYGLIDDDETFTCTDCL